MATHIAQQHRLLRRSLSTLVLSATLKKQGLLLSRQVPLRCYTAPSLTHSTHAEQTATSVTRGSGSHSDHHERATEIKDAKLIFNQAWKNIEDHYGRENIHLPREFIFLMGAPGSGKGTHTPSILRARGITNPPISVSQLLQTPECKELINQGQMISDRYVMELIFHAMLHGDPTVGILIDGFPRTDIQVEALRMLHDKMIELRREFWNTALRDQFPRPVFRIAVLYVDEEISVQRQLARGRMIREHNIDVRKTGQGVVWEERVTDNNETLIRERYSIFKAHYGSLLKLSKMFPFHLINATGTIKEVMQIILKEFEYQSSLELDSETFDSISHIPVATQIGIHARQDLINRLEHYQQTEPKMLHEAIDFIDSQVMPLVNRHSISGHANFRSEDGRLANSHFVDMVMDIMSERGYFINFDQRVHDVPKRIDLQTGEIDLETHYTYLLNIEFPKHYIRALEQKFD
ncbi:putative adenylate kinase [Halteromyces radiatus]|uniref:putative adenylate kinase n=1 Tax=Halteromyces radiatus TaxID=101107 RepID=UPI00221F0552|nr:putative adenylate kinase [Halteromyces radiatus]KAI8089402.1 putative adenylate kinase [Halteromyces radiatus]